MYINNYWLKLNNLDPIFHDATASTFIVIFIIGSVSLNTVVILFHLKYVSITTYIYKFKIYSENNLSL